MGALLECADVLEIVRSGVMNQSTVEAIVAGVLQDEDEEDGDGEAGQRAGLNRAAVVSREAFVQIIQVLDDAEQLMLEGQTVTNEERPAASASARLAAATTAAGEQTNSRGEEDNDDNVDDGDVYEPTEQELRRLTRELFDDLKDTSTGMVSVTALKRWEGVRGELRDGTLTTQDVDAAIAQALASAGGSGGGKGKGKGQGFGSSVASALNFDQFSEVLALLDDAMFERVDLDGPDDDDSVADRGSNAADGKRSPTPGRGTGAASKHGEETEDDTDEDDEDENDEDYIARAVAANKAAWNPTVSTRSSGARAQPPSPSPPTATSSPAVTSSGVGFARIKAVEAQGKAAKQKKNVGARSGAEATVGKQAGALSGVDAEVYAMTKEVFDELRGQQEMLSLRKLRQWDQLIEMVDRWENIRQVDCFSYIRA